jgi:hypothetical protein
MKITLKPVSKKLYGHVVKFSRLFHGQVTVLPTPDQTFRTDQPNNLAAVKKFGPTQNLLKNADITVLFTLFLSAKETKNQRY